MDSIKKPSAEFLLGLVHSLLDDLVQSNGRKNTERDKRTVLERVTFEGVEFLTKTLPLLGKAIDSALESGTFVCPNNFRRYKGTALPEFLRGLLIRIFDKNGNVLTDVDVASLTEARQVTLFCYKTKFPFSQQLVKQFSDNFKRVDSRLPISFESYGTRNLRVIYQDRTEKLSLTQTRILERAREYVKILFSEFDPKPIVPAHGPGIVAGGEKPHEKRVFMTKYRSIHNVYPYYRTFYINPTHLLDCVANYRDRNLEEVGINKVLFVPKDSRGPRVIACEPLEYQFVQQGLRRLLYDHIEHHPLTAGLINFVDQTKNQQLAELGSCEPWIATVDLKDASDSVSMALVDYLFGDTTLLPYLQGTRTSSSLLPTGEVVNLKKYAAMGSALCFPIEAVVFSSLIYGVYTLFEHLYPFQYVYGDDLILDREILPTLNEIFVLVGLTINQGKTYSAGFFRESCGKEFFHGDEVTGIKVRTVLDRSAESVVSTVELANQMFDRGYYKCDMYIRSSLRKICSIPYGYHNSSYLCYSSLRAPYLPEEGKRYWNSSLQYESRKVPFVKGTKYNAPSKATVHIYAEYFRKITNGWSPEYRSWSYAKRRKIKIIRRKVQIGT